MEIRDENEIPKSNRRQSSIEIDCYITSIIAQIWNMEDFTPEIFRAVSFDDGSFRFRDLSGVKLVKSDKIWLCDEISGLHGKRQSSVLATSKRYNISQNTMRNWYKRNKDGFELFPARGRPRSGDPSIAVHCSQYAGDAHPHQDYETSSDMVSCLFHFTARS
jgi:hypothetical protein